LIESKGTLHFISNTENSNLLGVLENKGQAAWATQLSFHSK